MAQERDLALPALRRPRRIHHGAGLLDQQARGAVDALHIARHRPRVPPVALKVEGPDPIARPRQIVAIGLHHLPRPGKAMRDHDHRAIRARLCNARHRRLTDAELRSLQPGALSLKLPERQRGQHKPKQQENTPPHASPVRYMAKTRASCSPPRYSNAPPEAECRSAMVSLPNLKNPSPSASCRAAKINRVIPAQRIAARHISQG